MTTRKQVAEYFNIPNQESHVKQYGSKQLFKVYLPNKGTFLVSYKTIVGKYLMDTQEWILTAKKYSVTTTRQINWFINQLRYSSYRMSDEI